MGLRKPSRYKDLPKVKILRNKNNFYMSKCLKSGKASYTFLKFTCEECGQVWENKRFCPKCGLEAKDYKKFHRMVG